MSTRVEIVEFPQLIPEKSPLQLLSRESLFLSFGFIALAVTGPSWALTVREAVELAVQNSPVVQLSRAQVDEAEGKLTENFSTFLPTLTAGANYLTDYRYAQTDINFNGPMVSVPQILPTTVYTLSARYTLFEGFAGVSRWKSARRLEAAAIHSWEWTRFEMERKVELQFFHAQTQRCGGTKPKNP
jgi:outer membrane protein TolC